ncbi:hypothetical protein PIB30_099619, partial [Stylosanthes scabra]|nr:hypothetical protein [Stylosanthes scabra]
MVVRGAKWKKWAGMVPAEFSPSNSAGNGPPSPFSFEPPSEPAKPRRRLLRHRQPTKGALNTTNTHIWLAQCWVTAQLTPPPPSGFPGVAARRSRSHHHRR